VQCVSLHGVIIFLVPSQLQQRKKKKTLRRLHSSCEGYTATAGPLYICWRCAVNSREDEIFIGWPSLCAVHTGEEREADAHTHTRGLRGAGARSHAVNLSGTPPSRAPHRALKKKTQRAIRLDGYRLRFSFFVCSGAAVESPAVSPHPPTVRPVT